MKTLICVFVTAAIVIVSAKQAEQTRSVSDFFDTFLTEWMHANPNNAALSNRYFSGAEQDAIDQQIGPETPEFWHAMALAQKGDHSAHAPAVERLAAESGWYSDDPIGLLGEPSARSSTSARFTERS